MFLLQRVMELMPHVAIVFILFFVCFNLGSLVLKKLIKLQLTVLSFFTALVVGYVILSYYYFCIGMMSLYKEPFLTYVPLALGIISVYLNRALLNSILHALSTHKKMILVILSVLFSIILVRALPDKDFDSNWYHLSQPLYYLKSGALYHVGGYIFPSGYPQFTEMLYLPLLHMGNSITTSVFMLVIYFILGYVLYVLVLTRTRNKQIALLALIALLSTPIIFTYSVTAYVDIFQGLNFLLAFYWLTTYINTRDKRELILASIMLIPVATAKYSGGLLCVILATYILTSHLHTLDKIKSVLQLSLFPVSGLVLWLIRNKIQVGNFLDPMGNVTLSHYGSDSVNYLDYLKGVNWLHTFGLLHGANLFDYLIPLMVIGLLIYTLRHRAWSNFVFIVLSLIFFRSMTPGTDYRFYIPFIPIIIFLALQAVSTIKNGLFNTGLIYIILACVFLQFFTVYQISKPLFVYGLGLKTNQDYKNHFFVQEPFMFYDPTGTVKTIVGHQKLIVKGVDLIYPTLEEFNAQDYSFANLNRAKIYSFKTLRAEMLKNGYSFILVNRGTLQNHFALWFTEKLDDKVSDNFALVYYVKTAGGKESFLYKTQ